MTIEHLEIVRHISVTLKASQFCNLQYKNCCNKKKKIYQQNTILSKYIEKNFHVCDTMGVFCQLNNTYKCSVAQSSLAQWDAIQHIFTKAFPFFF